MDIFFRWQISKNFVNRIHSNSKDFMQFLFYFICFFLLINASFFTEILSDKHTTELNRRELGPRDMRSLNFTQESMEWTPGFPRTCHTKHSSGFLCHSELTAVASARYEYLAMLINFVHGRIFWAKSSQVFFACSR